MPPHGFQIQLLQQKITGQLNEKYPVHSRQSVLWVQCTLERRTTEKKVFPVLLDDFKGLIPHSSMYFVLKAIICIILERTYRNTLKDLSSLEA